ncbi:OmpA family protein [uncultured Tenacibaculum sp.]|uniref:OmpA family protein n=1 Tax=uncultured Tenacibaculum sp. TaxID=174713 RepID=UPI002622D1C5|nr:OmpA family protein [uncultured Tenacibaculum sp.]
MRNFLKAFLVFTVFAIIAQFVHQDKTESTNDEHNVSDKTSKKEVVKKVTTVIDTINSKKKDSTLNVKKVVKPLFKNELTQLNFAHKFVTSSNNSRVLFPKQFYYFKDSIFNFLNKNQEKEIIITADYLQGETLDNGQDLGIARATYLKNKLVKYGINPKKIIVKSNPSNYTYDMEGFYADGIKISHQNIHPDKLKTIQNEITNKTLHSHFGNENFNPDRTLYAYLLEAKSYLNKHPNKKITITGHTDNVGEEKTNEWVSLQRAKNVANYFIQQGIDTSKITTLSKGDSSPIADNTTAQGRAKNRRIEITIN